MNRRPFFHITNDAHVVVQIMKGARPDMPTMTGKFADTLRPLITTCWNGTPSTRPTAKVLVDALRPNIVKAECTDDVAEVLHGVGTLGCAGDTFLSGTTGMTRVSPPVSYLRMSSVLAYESKDIRREGASSTPRGRSRDVNPLTASAVFRPLQPRASNQEHRLAPSLSSAPSKLSDGVFLEPDWQRAPRILVVDNIALLQDTAKKLLESYGCIVEVANDGAKAMDTCDWNKTKFDLVLMVCCFLYSGVTMLTPSDTIRG